MQRTTMSGLIVGLVLFCFGPVMLASEADELREKAKAVRNEAQVLAEQGKKDEAQRLEQEVGALLQAANEREQKGKPAGQKPGHGGAGDALRGLGQQLGDLLSKERKMRESKASEPELAEVRKQIVLTEQELKKVQAIRHDKGEHHPEKHVKGEHHPEKHAKGEHHPEKHVKGEHHPENCPPAEQLDAANRRIHHVRVAAENLKLADMPDMSHQLSERAEAMEREVREAQERIKAQAKDANRQRTDQSPEVRELREEIERLRAELKGLRQPNEKR